MADKIWKAFERRIAKYIGGERVPVSGRARGDKPDIDHSWLSVECKYKQRLPFWLHDAMAQAEASAMPRQLPCVILGERGKETGESFIVFRLRDARDQWL